MRRFCTAFAGGLALCAWAATAAEPPAPAGTEEEPPAAPEVVVTATRLPTTPEETGTVLTVWDETWIRGQGATEAGDALRLLPGLNLVRLGQPGAPTNLYLRGGESDHTLVLLDGFQINQDGGSFDWDDFTTAGLGSMILMRGAASALYGSDAMTGLVSLETVKGEGPPRTILSMAAGNLHATRERAQVLGADENVAYSASLERYDRTGSRDVNGDYRRTSFAGRVDLDPRDSTDLKIVAHKTESEFGATEVDSIETDPNESNDDEHSLLGVTWTERWHPLVSTTVKAWRWDEENAFTDPADPDETALSRTRNQFSRTGLDVQTTAHAPETEHVRASLAAGGVWQGQTVDWTSTFRDDDPVFPYESTSFIDESRHTRALYWTARATILERLDIEGGQRYEDHSSFGGETTSRVAASLRVDETHSRLHASYGTGFKEPTFSENFMPLSTFIMPGPITYITTGNLELEPERTESFDVGAEQHLLDGRVRVDVTYFHVDFDDFIAFRSVQTGPSELTSTFLNGDAATSRGWEIEGEVRVIEELSLRGNFTNMETEAETVEDAPPNVVDGENLLRRPETRWSLAATYRPMPRVELFASVTTTGDFYDGNWTSAPARRVKVDGHTRVDLSASWEFLDGWRVFGVLNNAFDEEGFEAFDNPIEPIHGLVGVEGTLKF